MLNSCKEFLLFCITAILTGRLSDRFPIRYIVVTGAVLATIGFVVSSFATNIYFVIFGYGVLVGVCFENLHRSPKTRAAIK